MTMAIGVRKLTLTIGPDYDELEVGNHTLEPYQGDCGEGKMHTTYTLTQGGNFNGTRTFDEDFCDDGLGLSVTGEFQVDATLGMNNMPIETTSTFDNLNFGPTLNKPAEPIKINGSVNFTTAKNEWAIANLVVAEVNYAARSYTLTDWLLSLTLEGNSVTEEFTGAYNDSRHGSVTIDGYAEIMLTEENPFDGWLEATASDDGSRGLLYFSENSFEIYIDSGSGDIYVETCDYGSVCDL